MKGDKQLRELMVREIELQNTVNRIEAKLDALLNVQLEEQELEAIQLPKKISIPGEVDDEQVPFNVRQLRMSTIRIPDGPDNIEVAAPATSIPELEHKDTIPLPDIPPSAGSPPLNPNLPDQGVIEVTKEPYEGYDKDTVGAILKRVKLMTPAQREYVLVYERAHDDRSTLTDALVNWNS